MVELIRRKNAEFNVSDVSSVDRAFGSGMQKIGEDVNKLGQNISKIEEKGQKEYKSKVEQNLKTEQTRIANEKKTFDAADKLVGSDMAGRLKNDLLRWNLEQRQNNPNYIGTPEHEQRMRNEYARLSSKYGQGLGEAGMAEFQNKTQSAVNEFVGNDVKWAYQQKIKQGEESAKNIAETMNQTAGMYGANGDVEGFKESHKENRDKLKEYAEDSGMVGSSPALYEVDKKSVTEFMNGMAQTDPVRAKAIMDSKEKFKEVVPDEMVDNVNDIAAKAAVRNIDEKLALVKVGIENSKKGSPQRRELEKQKKQLEKELVLKATETDLSDQSLAAIHKEVSDAIKPVLEKSLGESALIAKKEHEEAKVEKFSNFMTLPTPENLKWFEQENQMSYTPNVENMSEIPEDMKTQKQKNNDLIKNMLKYRENFGNVSMVEISDYKGTKQMFDDLKTVAQTDSDKDGNVDNVLLKTLVAANNAKQESISQSDYNNYLNVLNKSLYDRSFKNELNQFMEKTENFMPKQFWNKNSNVAFTTNRARLNEKMESKSRDVLSAVLKEWNNGMSGADASKMYRAGIQKAYNEVTSEALGINMEQIIDDYKQYGFSLATINGKDYVFKGIDSTGNPIWQPTESNGATTKQFIESARKVMNKKGE